MESKSADYIVVEESDLIVRVAFRTNCGRKETKLSLTERFVNKVIFVYEHTASGLNCVSIVSKLETINLDHLKAEIEEYFTSIRGCSVDRLCNQTTFYSPPKDINIKVIFYNDRSSFEARGDGKNLSKFLHGYSKCLQKLSPKPIDISPLTMTSLARPMSLCEKIERNITPTPPVSQDLEEDSTTQASIHNDTNKMSLCEKIERNLTPTPPASDDVEETQDPIFAIDTQSTQGESVPTNEPLPSLIIPDTQAPTTPNNHDQKLDTMIEKLSTLETNTANIPNLTSQVNQLIATIKDLTERLSNSEKRTMDLERDLTLARQQDKSSLEKIECRVFDLEDQAKVELTKTSQLEKSVKSLTNAHATRVMVNELECRVNISLDKLQKQITSINVANNTNSITDENSQHPDLNRIIDEKVKEYIANSQTNNANRQRKEKYTPTKIDELDHDLLLIGDSNTYAIKEDILKHGMSATKIMAYKIDQAITAIQEIQTIKRQPMKIIIFTGTNHVSSKEGEFTDFDEIEKLYGELFAILEEKFPESEIYISELLIRREKNIEGDMKRINAFLKTICSTTHKNFHLIQHSFNINSPRHHLKDNRHVSRSGFFYLLLNIRLQALGIAPKMYSRHPNHRHQPYRRFRR